MAGEHDVNANCGWGDLVCAGAEGFINSLFHGVTDSLGGLAKSLGSFWVNTPSIPLTGKDNAVYFIRESTSWYVAALLVVSILIAAGQMMWTRKGQPLTDLLASLLKFAIMNAASVTGVTLLLRSGDEFSAWIIGRSTDEGFDKALSTLIGPEVFKSGITVGIAIFAIVMGIIAIIVAVIQIGLLIVRSAMALILVGTLPLAFSATNTSWGKQWSQKHVSWLIAFILYKPVASIVYAAAFKVFGSVGKVDGDDGQRMMYFISGLVLMIAALFALPAMMRLIVPAVGAASGAGAMFAGAAVGSAASGAVNFGSRIRGAGRGGGGAGGGGGAAAGGGGGGAATGAAAAKGGGSLAKSLLAKGAGVATGGAGAIVMTAGAAVKGAQKGGQAISSAVHDAAGEQVPQQGSKQQGGGARGSRGSRGGGVTPPSRGGRGARRRGSSGSAQPNRNRGNQ
ncbi:hypothetical protein HMPREF2674_03430 [Rothia sp. HMSC062F03]|uniref:hypothetical protein n=1 Tax=Rothia sp. HMSC062F03 TaxID=1715153 RepID=UPI0008A91A01|nr:hypothetical protein [Rothia sp. HMSC062F03]OHP73730.1 hypothetical protein HMPREF2674_03430 [Rothia sp. HMSC062F03]